ncbi:hypothetical protein HC776_01060 [bacterium]|nr:hypothetical protein [bacterium]
MEIRLAATRQIWGTFGFIMLVLIGSTVFSNSGLGLAHIIIVAVVAIAASLGTGMVWNWGDTKGEDAAHKASKHKRGSIERVADELDSMSDDDLQRLRARLSGDVRDVLTTPAYGLGDDGELMRRR